MPKVPEYNLKPLKPILTHPYLMAPISGKQKDYIIQLCQKLNRRVPEFGGMTKAQGTQIIDRLKSSAKS